MNPILKNLEKKLSFLHIMNHLHFANRFSSICLTLVFALTYYWLESCSSAPVYHAAIRQGEIEVPRTLFYQTSIQIVRPEDYPYDIALERQDDGTYLALILQCTYGDSKLSYTGGGFACALHGCAYDIRGEVAKGPASSPLKKLPTQIDNTNVIVQGL